MTDPAMTTQPASGSMTPQLTNLLKWMGAGDFLCGAALVVVGLWFDEVVISGVGLVLMVSGTALMAWMIIRSNRPTQL